MSASTVREMLSLVPPPPTRSLRARENKEIDK